MCLKKSSITEIQAFIPHIYYFIDHQLTYVSNILNISVILWKKCLMTHCYVSYLPHDFNWYFNKHIWISTKSKLCTIAGQKYYCKTKYDPLKVQKAMGLTKYWGLSHVLLLLLRISKKGFNCKKFVFVHMYCINQAFLFWTDLNTNWIVSNRGNSWNVIAVKSGQMYYQKKKLSTVVQR